MHSVGIGQHSRSGIIGLRFIIDPAGRMEPTCPLGKVLTVLELLDLGKIGYINRVDKPGALP